MQRSRLKGAARSGSCQHSFMVTAPTRPGDGGRGLPVPMRLASAQALQRSAAPLCGLQPASARQPAQWLPAQAARRLIDDVAG